MLFTSYQFILFVLIALILYYVAPKRIQWIVLLCMNMLFYVYAGLSGIIFIVTTIITTYAGARLICREKDRSVRFIEEHKGDISRDEKKKLKNISLRKQKMFLTIVLFINFGILAVLKYTNMFIVTFTTFNTVDFVLPMGISFYTFQILSYIIDVYRGNVKVQKNILNFALYVTMFPQLIAGPIVQYADVEEQLVNRESSWNKFGEGCMYFIRGLAKKVLLANTSGMIFTEVTGLGKGNVSVLSAWLGAFAYMFQIYFDFSGYSDMAVGLGKMFGFEFCMNFNYPYIAKSITEFWRRWHISLSSWFRDYVYIPLGGNRVSKSRHIFNLMVVWFLTGLWHGAAWNFVAWGLYYGIILIIEKYILSPVLDKLPSVVRHIYSIVLVVIGWVLFFSPSLGGAARYLGMMFGAGAHGVADRESLYLLTTNLVLWIILIIGSTPLTDVRYQHMLRRKNWNTTLLNGIVYAVLFILCIAYLVTETYNPFLYFRF